VAADNPRRADFYKNRMKGAFLIDKNLRRVVLKNEDFTEARLIAVNLRKAMLDGSVLKRTSLLRVNMDNASLAGCDLQNAELYGVSMRSVDLRKTNLSDARFSGVNLEEADLSDSSAFGTSFMGVNMRSVYMNNINAQGANFSGGDLSEAMMKKANFRGVNFSGADLSAANLANAIVDGADFSGADLSDAIVKGVDFSKAKVEGALFFHALGLRKEQIHYIEANSGLVYTPLRKKWDKIINIVAANRGIQVILFIFTIGIIWFGVAYFSEPQHKSNEALRRLAEKKHTQGKFGEATALYQILANRNIQNNIKDFSPQFAIAAIYRQNKDFNSAIAVLHKLLELPDLSASSVSSIYAELAQAYRDMGKLEEAKKAFQLSIDIDIKNDTKDRERLYWSKISLIEIQRQEGKREEPLKAYEELMNEYKDSPWKVAHIYANIGQAYRDMGKLEEAKKAFRLSIDIDINNNTKDRERLYWSKISLIEIQRQEGKCEEALKAYEELMGEYKESSWKAAHIYANIGQVYREMGKLEEAKKAFQLSLKKDSSDREQLYWSKRNLIEIQRQEGKHEEALKAYKELMDEYKDPKKNF
jgi:uncharacterized protein YjbI with pentapeptide repeats/TolA-binding protein